METSDTPPDHEATTMSSPVDTNDEADATAAASSSSDDRRRRGSGVLLELNAIAHTLESLNEVLVDILTLTAPPPPSSSDAAAEEGEGHHGGPKNFTIDGEMGGTNTVSHGSTSPEGTGNERSIAVKQHRLLMELKMWESLLGTQEDDGP